MTKEASKENKPNASFKTLINVLRPIRDWLKNTPPVAHIPNGRASVSSSTRSNNNLKGSSNTINGSSTKSNIVHTNHLLGNGAVEYNTHLMRQQQQQLQLQQQQQQQQQQQFQFQLQQQQQQLYSQPNAATYRRSLQSNGVVPQPPPLPLPRPAPIIGNEHFASITPNQQQQLLQHHHHHQQQQQQQYYSTTPISLLNSNSSSTPVSANQNTSSLRDDNNSAYMLSSTTVHRQTPIINATGPLGTMDDLNGSANTNGIEEQFKRNAKARMSLPLMQQKQLRRQAYSQLQRRGQLPPQSLGHIYLQHKGETKQANLPNELTAIDTIRALFVCAFPNMLTMEYMSQPHVKIYIYNPSCNIFYELHNIDDVRHESVLRIHQSNPILALPPQPQYTMRLAPQVPPPKPRRMVPVNGLQPNPNAIYGISTPVPQRPPDQQQQQQQQQLQQHHQIQQQQQHRIHQKQQQPQQLQQQPIYGSSTSNIYSFGRSLPALPQIPPPPPQPPTDCSNYSLERGSFCQLMQ